MKVYKCDICKKETKYRDLFKISINKADIFNFMDRYNKEICMICKAKIMGRLEELQK